MPQATIDNKQPKNQGFWSIAGKIACPFLVFVGFGSILMAGEYSGWLWTLAASALAIVITFAFKRFLMKGLGKIAIINLAALLLTTAYLITTESLNTPAYQQYKAQQNAEQKTTDEANGLDTKASEAQETQEISAESQPVHVITPKEAKTIAYNALVQMDQSGEDLITALTQTDEYGYGDRAGYGKYVVQPLSKIVREWPDWHEEGNEAMQPYGSCYTAVYALWNLGSNFKRPPSVERQHSIQKDVAYYEEDYAMCKQAIGIQ